MKPHVLTPADVAKALRVSLPTVYNLLQSGALPAARCGSAWRIAPEALARFLHGGRGAPAQETTSND